VSVVAPTALLLDVDDTLIDTRAAMVVAGAAAVSTLWPSIGAGVPQAAGVHFQRDPAGIFARYASGELTFAQMRQGRVSDLVQSFSLPDLDGVGIRFDQAYEPAFVANLAVFDDVWPLVKAARSAAVPIGLLTNSSSHYTQLKLEITGLAGVFAVVATRDTLGFGKPDPRAFHHACGLLGSHAAATLYVGDHLEIDAIAGAEAGLQALWLQRRAVSHGAVSHGAVSHGAVSHGAALERARSKADAELRGIPVVTSLSQVTSLLTR